jgi:cell division protein FtsW
VGISVAAMIVAYFLPYRKLQNFGLKILGAGFVLCALVFLLGKIAPGSGLVTCDEGACRSFHLPGIGLGFQPVEIVKIGVLLYLPWLIRERRAQKALTTMQFWLPLGIIAGLIAVLVAFGLKDFGSTMVLFAMIFAMAFIGGVSIKQIGIALLVGAVGVVIMIITSPHRMARLASFGDNYHVENSLISLGTGGVFGVGLGNSIQSTGYLPEALSDSIFAIIGEVLGFIGAFGVVLIFAFIIWRMISISRRTDDEEESLYTVGVAAWIFAHAIINIGGMTGLIPVKGITLPFLSYGGTSMLFVAFALGVVLQISGWTKREVIDENISSRRRERGSRHAGYRRS